MGCAAAMGLGIWSMHSIGMLAYTLPVPIFYHWPTVLLSLLTAILASAIVLLVASATRYKSGPAQQPFGSIVFTRKIARWPSHVVA
jgi:NO-binding membrane sensor protein with MHYT domain